MLQIATYIDSLQEPKRRAMQQLHASILALKPDAKLWFLDGKNSDGKVIANPNIGYGSQLIKYADGSQKEFYQVGISANTTGISVYIMGLADKNYLIQNFGDKLGKANVTGYCIKFKSLQDIDVDVLKAACRMGLGIENG
ncbi:MAG: hypothetical protein RL699_779 [Bacteroidota bacterium]|jgi:hypothetical protein